MTDNEIRTRTIYFLTKRVPDENYDLYVGSTSMSLEERLRSQNALAKQEDRKKSKVLKRMNEVGVENWKIVPLLTLDCTKEEIRSFERKWCELLEADLNTNSPITSKEKILEKRRVRYGVNREKNLKKAKAYYAANRGKRKEYYAANREKRKEYYAANKEKILERERAHRKANTRKEG